MTPVYIHSIETGHPANCYSQEEARERIKAQFDDRKSQRIIHHIYNQSGIDKRYSAVGEFGGDDPQGLFSRGDDGKWTIPGTGERNARFVEVSHALAVELGRRTLEATPGIGPEAITHVITVSCTGFYNPGPDYYLVRELGLKPSTERYQLGFMGCYAAFPALRMAKQFCEADPTAVVMVLCMELCSLHLQLEAGKPDSLVAGSIFGDGAACVLVSAQAPASDRPAFVLRDLHSDLAPSGESAMAWDIGNTGFDIVLSSYVPEILGTSIRGLVEPLLQRCGMDIEDIDDWAVHPGGKAILDKVRDGLGLEENLLATSRRVLREYGNMSSATVLFVLKEFLNQECSKATPRAVTAMAFGPGLTVELGVLDWVPAACEMFDAAGDAASLSAGPMVSI